MKFVFSENTPAFKEKLRDAVLHFSERGEVLSTGRNEIRISTIEGRKINIKSFRIPNAVNKIAYKYFRKSKAQRSFEYASILLEKEIGTPAPLAFAEETQSFKFGKSYYLCEHLEPDWTYRDLTPKQESVVRAFTRFTYELHEKQVLFLDHSPGNTLIVQQENDYDFYLVDLNRMIFKELNFNERMKNFSRLTPDKAMVEIMADEYAKLIDKSPSEVFAKMWFFTNQFQKKFHRKKRIKKRLKFWK